MIFVYPFIFRKEDKAYWVEFHDLKEKIHNTN